MLLMRKILMNENVNDVSLCDVYEKFVVIKSAMNLSKESMRYYKDCYKFFTHDKAPRYAWESGI